VDEQKKPIRVIQIKSNEYKKPKHSRSRNTCFGRAANRRRGNGRREPIPFGDSSEIGS
jgi:hypothetical protein